MEKISISVFAVIALAGCSEIHEMQLSSEKSELEQQAAQQLRDPNSVQYRNTYLTELPNLDDMIAATRQNKKPFTARVATEKSDRTLVLCGELNGKNAYGAYVGYTRFFYAHKNLRTEPQTPDKKWIWWFGPAASELSKLPDGDSKLKRITEHGLSLYELDSSESEKEEFDQYQSWNKYYAEYCLVKKE